MATVSSDGVEELKFILENSRNPERLDLHPWTSSPIVQEIEPQKSPGERLVLAVSQLFIQMMPSTPPKRGKRLDSRWAEFGILAARYFAPLQYGTPLLPSLRDAWGRIDQSILYFVYGKPVSELSATQIEPYQLVSAEPDVASISTLSDWHRKGLQRLRNLIKTREKFLMNSINSDDVTKKGKLRKRIQSSKSTKAWPVIMGIVLLFLGLLVIGGIKVHHAYELALIVRQDAVDLRLLLTKDSSRLERIRDAGPAIATFRQDFEAFQTAVHPFLWSGRLLRWVPIYGGDLASAQDLVTLGDSLLEATETSYQALLPLLEQSDGSDLNLPRLTERLVELQPQLSKAKSAVELASQARSQIDPAILTPELRDLITKYVDRALPALEDGLTIALELPRLLGTTEEGPKTYLLLVQNEDELRPSGGFITAAGTLLIDNGEIRDLEFLNSDLAEDWSKPYPTAPWQLQEYMNSPVLIFRDANWFADYRMAAPYAEQLYSYTNNHSVDGVIAFDQHLLVEILSATGPIEVAGVDFPIDAGNVMTYMRTAKTPPPAELYLPDWNTKDFLNKMAFALMAKMLSGDVKIERLVSVLINALDQRHVLLQVDNPILTQILNKRRWDGAIHPAGADFLMVVDTNVGFNKSNLVVESSLRYEVDLTKRNSILSFLDVTHKNNAVAVGECSHWKKLLVAGEEKYPVQDCYWNYLRVFMPKGTFLLDATPQSIPADWMILKDSPPARVDILDEGIGGVQEFGTMQVVPASDSLTTQFRFLLPPNVVQPGPESGQWLYRLRVQKQPGTQAVPITIHIRLPINASLLQFPERAVIDGNSLQLQTDLRTDLEIEALYQVP